MAAWAPRSDRIRRAALGALAAALWATACVRWFDAGAAVRPAWLAAFPPLPLLLLALALAAAWAWTRWPELAGPKLAGPRGGLALVLLAAAAVRLPLALQASAGYLTADGALSGIVALRIREGAERLVFIPHVPYSGSLKSHLTAALAVVVDPSRAFALASVAFYVLFVAAVYRLTLMAVSETRTRAAVAAGLYLAFAPSFITRYSLSNDGNYVEVLALGTWALVLAARWIGEPKSRPPLAMATGLLLGLAFWCHILAAFHAAAVGLALLLWGRVAGLRAIPRLAAGFFLGYLPGLLWNAGNSWTSFLYLLPGAQSVGDLEAGPGFVGRVLGTAFDLYPVLLGYEPGYPAPIDLALRLTVAGIVVLTLSAAARALRDRTDRARPAIRVAFLFAAVNVAGAVMALPYIPGNPRYLLFLAAPIAVLLAASFGFGRRAALLVVVASVGVLGSVAAFPAAARTDQQWRRFVADLEAEGVRHCFTDFYLATKVNFLSEERVVCSAKLGPTTTEYFFDYRREVDAAADAALLAVNQTAAEKLERRLERLGVRYERRDLMKPVLLRLERKVDPAELFPGREFPLR
jgi:hypothetical protein